MVDLVDMGNFFTECREKNNYTQYEVASFIGVCIKTIQNLEGGKKNTDFSTILMLCDLYGISLSTLHKFYSRHYKMDYAIKLYQNSDKGKLRKFKIV